MIFIFLENSRVVNFGHGGIEDVHNYDITWKDFWKGLQLDLFDFSLLKAPPEEAWYVLQE